MENRNYTTDKLITNYLNKAVYDEEITPFIEAAQKYIENYTGRIFKADEEATARLYDGNDKDNLVIDDCIEITKVEIGADAWGDNFNEVSASGTSRYYTLPTNNSELNEPIRKIGLRANIFVYGHANQRITAKWGSYETVPKDLQFAATVIASGMYNQNRGENTGAIKSEKIGEYSVTYADQKGFSDLELAKQTLDSYKKYEI